MALTLKDIQQADAARRAAAAGGPEVPDPASRVVAAQGIALPFFDLRDAPAGAVIGADGLPRHALEVPLLDGLPLYAYGHSGLFVGLGTAYAYAAVNYYERIARRMRASSGVPGYNSGIPGALASDAAAYAFGAMNALTRRAGESPGTWAPVPRAYPGGVAIIDAAGNSSHNDHLDSAKMRAGTKHGLDALIRLIRAGQIIQDNDASFVYAGTWTSLVDSHIPGGREHYTSTTNDHVTITTPVGTDFDLILGAFDDAALGAVGSTFTVTVDGAPFTWPWNPGTISNQTSFTNSAFAGEMGFSPMALPLRGLSNIAHTVVLKNTAAHLLNVQQLLVPTPTPPTIVLVKAARSTLAGYGVAGGDWATDQIYNGYVDMIAARFPAGEVLVWDPNEHGWDPATMASSADPDHLHSNDLGMQCYADGILDLLAALPARAGLQII